MKSSTSNKVVRWLRMIHRDLGFLMVGICFVYAISGILLNHMDGKDPAFKTTESMVELESGLTAEELNLRWNDHKELPSLRKIFKIDDDFSRLMLEGGVGIYAIRTGEVHYEQHTKREFVYWINKLHYNKVKGWSVMADFFAASLIFFAISGLFMVKGKHGIMQRGKWFLIAGLLIPILYLMSVSY